MTVDSGQLRLSAAEADARLSDSWFEGYCNEVAVHEAPVTVDEFDAAQRLEEQGDTEYILFAGGLTVRGTLDLGSDVHSIYAVIGSLRAKRLVLGDAILVVDGSVHVDEMLFGPRGEGLFEVAGHQVEPEPEALLAHVQAPLIVLYDRRCGEYVVREHGAARQLAPGLVDADGYMDPQTLRERLLAGESVLA
jgi:hypothetical protein